MRILLYGIPAAFAMAAAVWIAASKLCVPPVRHRETVLLTLAVSIAGMILACVNGFPDFYFPYFLRWVTVLACTTGAAVCDFREKKIPDVFPFVMLGAFLTASVLDSFLVPDNPLASFLGGVLSGGIIFLFLLMFRGISLLLFHHQGIGMGDLKLLTSMGCLIGIYGVLGALLLGQIGAVLFAAGLLITHKAGVRDTIPLAPFLCAGLSVSALLGVF